MNSKATAKRRWFRRVVLIAGTSLLLGVVIVVALGEWMLSRDTVVPDASLIMSDPVARRFTIEATRITPKSFNFDNNRLEYDFETRLSTDSLLATLDAIARSDGWTTLRRTPRHRTFTKSIKFNDYFEEERFIEITPEVDSSAVHILAYRGAWKQLKPLPTPPSRE